MTYDLVLLVLGGMFLVAAIGGSYLRNRPVSLPMVHLGVGILIPLVWSQAPRIDPVSDGALVERLAELAVIISLMSAGLKIDRPVGWHRWSSTWRLLAVTMPLCIIGLAVGGHWLGLSVAAALLLGAVLAPTDPVLAATVQVGPPGEGEEHEVRFALTSEAGLNDGLAFPFVYLAIVVAATHFAADGLIRWALVDVFWRIGAGLVIGYLIGRGVAWVVFSLSPPEAVSDGFLAIALTLFAYGAAELAYGYGFLAVFVAALVFRRFEADSEYHRALHDFSAQMEELLMAVILIGFGMSIGQGLLSGIGWRDLVVALAFLAIIRPAAGYLALLGSGVRRRHRAVIAVLGIRGIGTFYYLAYGINQGAFPEAGSLWRVAGLVVFLSVVLHGFGAIWAMKRVD